MRKLGFAHKRALARHFTLDEWRSAEHASRKAAAGVLAAVARPGYGMVGTHVGRVAARERRAAPGHAQVSINCSPGLRLGLTWGVAASQLGRQRRHMGNTSLHWLGPHKSRMTKSRVFMS